MKLSERVTEYVSFKQSIGMRYRSEPAILRSFCKAIGDIEIEEVTPASAAAFIAGAGPITTFWHRKYEVLRGFYHFALTRGYVEASPLPKTVPKRPETLKPYIYSTEELHRLLSATDSLQSPISPLQAITFRTILLTLYGTGLRISEALSLTIADVNVSDSLITVRNTKFYKTRLVPIGPHLTEYLDSYLKKRRLLPCQLKDDSAFFVTRTGHALSYDRMRKTFRLLRNLSGITRRDSTRYSPRIHDLRHTFTVHRLEAWYREGADVQLLLPRLSTYLGHKDVAETQCYLSMTPDLLREANLRFEHYALSEVNHV
jgi:site-specific recombinase XerD